MRYIHEHKNWPKFYWDQDALAGQLADLRLRQGRLLGRMENLGFNLRAEADLLARTTEVLKTSEIEGEILDQQQVRSSIARRLGMDVGGLTPSERHVEGVVELMLDATLKFESPLSTERLFGWHAALFPTGRSGMIKINVGKWRDDSHGPMQVISGSYGKEKVHFEAPAAKRIRKEMQLFIQWFNRKSPALDPLLKAAIAHFWFVTLHPFEDGNGRIARAVADMALARSEHSSQRFYSMSARICRERKDYYEILELSQRGDLDITPWISWFLGCLARAFDSAEEILKGVLKKSRFWEKHVEKKLNDRQTKILNLLLDGFEGKLTSSKWALLAKCSQDTASRDIENLIELEILVKNPGGGRSTSYSLK